MPTVKTSGGKVLLKGGKVSCSCCSPSVCCLYPAPKPNSGPLYPSSDLPSSIKVNGQTFTRDEFSYTGPDGQVIICDSEDTDNWLAFLTDVTTENGCLIGEWPDDVVIEDEFSYGYLLEGLYDVSGSGDFEPMDTEIVRNDPPEHCTWLQFSPDVFYVRYNSETFKWEFFSEDYPEEILQKDDPQDSPVGSYGSSEHFQNVEVL